MSPAPNHHPMTAQTLTIGSQPKLTQVPTLWITLWQSIVLLSAFFVGQLAGVALVAPWVLLESQGLGFGDKVLQGGTHGTVTALAVMLTLGLVCAVAWLLVRLQGNRFSDYLALRRFSGSQLLACGVALIVLNVVINGISVWLDRDPMGFMDALAASAQPFWLLVVAMVIAAPIYEEVIFRGFMWTGLAHSRLGAWGASVITSLIFALIHFQYGWVELASIGLLAMLFSYARYVSGSLYPPIVLHIANNGLAMWQYVNMSQ